MAILKVFSPEARVNRSKGGPYRKDFWKESSSQKKQQVKLHLQMLRFLS
jgi:hypothetical protein